MKQIKAIRLLILTFWISLFGLVVVAAFKFSQAGVPPQVSYILQEPGAQFWLGTDSLGRDFFWRLFFSVKNSLLVGFFVGVFALGIATVLAVLSIFRFKLVDEIFVRVTDFFQVVPGFVFVSLLAITMGTQSIGQLILIIGLLSWMNSFRVLKARVLQILQEDFITSAVALGADRVHIIRYHILPHLKETMKVLFILQFSNAIVYESSISFIGLGLQSPETSLGILLQEGWRTMNLYPWLMLAPVLLFGLIILNLRYFFDEVLD